MLLPSALLLLLKRVRATPDCPFRSQTRLMRMHTVLFVGLQWLVADCCWLWWELLETIACMHHSSRLRKGTTSGHLGVHLVDTIKPATVFLLTRCTNGTSAWQIQAPEPKILASC